MSKKKALGRGLSALLSDSVVTEESVKVVRKPVKRSLKSVNEISIEQIETNPYQPRTTFHQDQLNDLAQSIKELGVIQPITVRKVDINKYQLISGERRYRASQLVGLDSIPAFVRTANDTEMLEMALVENIQRQELDAIEVALSYQRLIEECELTQEKMSERVGKKRSTITNYLRLLQLQPLVQAGVRDQMISLGHAKALLAIDDEDMQLDAYKKVVALQLSVRQIEELARGLKNGTTTKKKAPEVDKKWEELNNKVSSKIGAKTSLKFSAKGNGKLTINFKDESELEKIMALLQS
mgnify:CR=1 FL=1